MTGTTTARTGPSDDTEETQVYEGPLATEGMRTEVKWLEHRLNKAGFFHCCRVLGIVGRDHINVYIRTV